MTVGSAQRWPVHPPPEPLESLSSWVNRLAVVYNVTVVDLLRRGLGVRVARPRSIDDILDRDPPAGLLGALNDRTGVPVGHLQAMTLVGWEPLLLETWARERERAPEQLAWSQAAFEAYVRDNSVLLNPREIRRRHVPYRRARSWWGPWQLDALLDRRCPVCWTPTHRVARLVWRLPMVSSCCDGAVLVDPIALVLEHMSERTPQPEKVGEPLAQLDRYTYQGLRTGQVQLPGRTVHVAVWLRMLRALLDEVSLSGSIPKASHAILARVWDATPHPYRANLSVWQPYEHMKPGIQEAMMDAAAAAVQLAAAGEVRGHGVYGSALREQPHRPVPPGDQPDPRAVDWQEAAVHLANLLTDARTNHVAAHRLLRLITLGSRDLRTLRREIAWLAGARVPPRFFANYPELQGRVTPEQLLAAPCDTPSPWRH